MNTTTQQKPTHVTTADGRQVKIADMQKSFNEFQSYCRKALSDSGEPFLTDCVTQDPGCGCTITGNGSLPFPLAIKFCSTHAAIAEQKDDQAEIFETLRREFDAIENDRYTSAKKRFAELKNRYFIIEL